MMPEDPTVIYEENFEGVVLDIDDDHVRVELYVEGQAVDREFHLKQLKLDNPLNVGDTITLTNTMSVQHCTPNKKPWLRTP